MSAQRPILPYSDGPKNNNMNNYRRDDQQQQQQSYNYGSYQQQQHSGPTGRDAGRRPLSSSSDGYNRMPQQQQWPSGIPYQFSDEVARNTQGALGAAGLPSVANYNANRPKHLSASELHGMPLTVPLFSNAQNWMMHPSGEHLLPQVGNLPLSSFSSSQGSPDSSDYGSGPASNADLSSNDMLSGRESSLADVDATQSLKARVQQQIEYYFSAPNLARDAFLISHMDTDHYALVTLIAGFNCVRRLTTDLNLITNAIRTSSKLELDESGTKVRPRSNRSTVVIRDLPEDVKREDLEALFAKQTVVKPINYEFVDKTCWYVEFEEESEAQEALRYLREEAQDFCGKPIYSRIRAIPVTPGSVNAFRSSDNSHPGPGVGVVHAPMIEDPSVHMVRPPGDMLPAHPYPPYAAFPNPNAPFFPSAVPHPGQVNPGLLVWPPMPGVTYVDMYNMLNMANMANMYPMQPQPQNPPMYRGGGPQSGGRGRGRGGGRGGNYNQNNNMNNGNRRGRGGSNPNSGRNSAMSESRYSEHNHFPAQTSENRGSRHGSFSSVNNDMRGFVSPSSVRSGSNTPPVVLPDNIHDGFLPAVGVVEERRNSFPTQRKPPKRPVNEPVQNEEFRGSPVPPIVSKDVQPKFDLESTMFPPLPVLLSSELPHNGSAVSPPAMSLQPVNMSTADVVRGVVNPKMFHVTGKSDAEAFPDVHDVRGKGYSSDDPHHGYHVEVSSGKKEQGSSTDDLPQKTARDHSTDHKDRVEVASERSSRVNSSAGTQTAAVLPVDYSLSHAAESTQTVTVRPDKRAQAKKSSPAKHDNPERVVSARHAEEPVASGSGSGGPPSTDDGHIATSTDGAKLVSVENGGKGSTFTYARIAQINRDKLLSTGPPGLGSGLTSSKIPLTKQVSVDSSSQSQDDRRSLTQERVYSGNKPKQPVATSRDSRIPYYGRPNDAPTNGHGEEPRYFNGGAQSSEPKDDTHDDVNNDDDNEGFTEVTKHKPVRHERRVNNAAPMMRYGGPSN